MSSRMGFNCCLDHLASTRGKPGTLIKFAIMQCELDVWALYKSVIRGVGTPNRLGSITVVPQNTPAEAPSRVRTAHHWGHQHKQYNGQFMVTHLRIPACPRHLSMAFLFVGTQATNQFRLYNWKRRRQIIFHAL